MGCPFYSRAPRRASLSQRVARAMRSHADGAALDAARAARAECLDTVARMQRKLRHNGVPEPSNLAALCDAFAALSSELEAVDGEALCARDSSADDEHLRLPTQSDDITLARYRSSSQPSEPQ